MSNKMQIPMTKPCCLLAFCGGLLLAGAPGFVQAQQRIAKKDWQTDYIAARELAQKTGKPMMVVLRCGP